MAEEVKKTEQGTRAQKDDADYKLAHVTPEWSRLTAARKRFVVLYASGLDGPDAYRKAYKKIETEKTESAVLLRDPNVAACIAEMIRWRDAKLDSSRDKMAKRLYMLFGSIVEAGGLMNPHSQKILLQVYQELNKMYGNYAQPEANNTQQTTIVLTTSTAPVDDTLDVDAVDAEVIANAEDAGNKEQQDDEQKKIEQNQSQDNSEKYPSLREFLK